MSHANVTVCFKITLHNFIYNYFAILGIITDQGMNDEQRKLKARMDNPEKFKKIDEDLESRLKQASQTSHVITKHIQPKVRLTPVQVAKGTLPGPSSVDEDDIMEDPLGYVIYWDKA